MTYTMPSPITTCTSPSVPSHPTVRRTLPPRDYRYSSPCPYPTTTSAVLSLRYSLHCWHPSTSPTHRWHRLYLIRTANWRHSTLSMHLYRTHHCHRSYRYRILAGHRYITYNAKFYLSILEVRLKRSATTAIMNIFHTNALVSWCPTFIRKLSELSSLRSICAY